MRFWDSSALVPAVIAESTSPAVRRLLQADPAITVAWHCEVECTSAVARLERTGGYSTDEADDAFRALAVLRHAWVEMDPTAALRVSATRLLRVHDLRAADALQLASAIAAAEGHPDTLEFVSLDDRLVVAARREGFAVVVPGAD